jgi:16S rRNA (cytosine967-C5)-methyltransferase
VRFPCPYTLDHEPDIIYQMDRMELSPARKVAFEILEQVAGGKADPASLLHSVETSGLQTVDLDLITEIVYGVLRWQRELDHILESHSKRNLAQIDSAVLVALRIGAYQIRHLSRIPVHSAVDESVKLARVYGRRGAHGFVNAVLRGMCRSPDRPRFPTSNHDPLGFLSVTLSHPEWLARRYLNRLGLRDAEARCRRNNKPPPVDIRIDPPLSLEEARAALADEGITAAPFPLVPRCLRARYGKVVGGPLHRSNSIFIQEAGSQLIPYLLDLRAGDRVLDACAAPGAKATEMSRFNHPGPVVAMENRSRRLAVLARLSRDLGCSNLLPVGGDAGKPPFIESFSRILLDAPCSSLGTLNRNPDIKWRLEESDLKAHGEEQLLMLESCSALLTRGGRLVYATCSTEPEENEEVIQRFLDRNSGYRKIPAPDSFPSQARELISDSGSLIIRPERDDMDGYYAVVVERTQSPGEAGGFSKHLPKPRHLPGRKCYFSSLPLKAAADDRISGT